uniref:AAA family ATPase n=1 Tax=candidate division CPR3 bacterium TaxID=2268181 RepID=A0A7C4R244_UNCC3
MTQNQALTILKTGANVFLTGEPGSGKTYTINGYVNYLRSHGIEPAITASTGIAATHIGGMTIHSWSGIGVKNRLSKSDLHNIITNEYAKKRIENASVLIIDEVSMLPPETLDMVDLICREIKGNQAPFGGIQVVLVGDFFQLPPVVKKSIDEYSQDALFGQIKSRFVYGSDVWENAELVTCYITEQYRQDDDMLTSILSKIRSNSFGADSLANIKKRRVDAIKTPEYIPRLFSHNVDVDMVNNQMLAKIPGKTRVFPMITKGHEALVAVMKKGCLSPENLQLKIGASVMFTKNSPKGDYVNGTLGIIEGFSHENGLPIVKIRNGHKIEASYADWTVEEDGKVRGKLTQIPLRLAWAITVHKSQGISLDEAVMDLSSVFEFGQGYVALSRVRRLSGIHILGWNEKAFQVNPEVLEKDKEFRLESENSEKEFSTLPEEKLKKMHEEFILFCGGSINISTIKPKKKGKKPSTYDLTFDLWKKGEGIEEIAKNRDMSEKTIFGHIEELVEKGKIKKDELMRIVPKKLLVDLPKIHTTFKNLETDRLTPVFDKLKGKYSYDELRLARVLME